MKVKFIIKSIPQIQTQSTNKISTSSRNKDDLTNNNLINDNKKALRTNSQSEDFFEYNLKNEENLSNLTISSVKFSFSKYKKINPDSIIFYKLNKENLYEEITDLIKFSDLIINGLDHTYELYYKINSEIVKITVDFYQMNIEKIFMKLSINCSIKMLKMIINEKLTKFLQVDSQKIYGLYILDINSKEKKMMNQSREINDSITLKNLINLYFEENNSQYMIYFLLSRNKNNKLQMGLNFKFNYLKNISKITFNQNAPKHCECSDGINLFAYCRNKECIIFNNLFIKVLGYGIFDIMKEIEKVYCPFCKYKSEVKNIGLINCKWFYKGKLNGSKQNNFEGDGITIDNQLYILKEAKISSLLLKLIIEVKPHITRKHLSENNINHDLEDIALCEQNNKEKNTIEDMEILQRIKDNVKYYETESEIKSMDVQLDRAEKNICNTCSITDDNLCNIF